MVRERFRRGRRWATRRWYPAPDVEPMRGEDVAALGYASQIGQDVFLDRHVFAGMTGGVFVDVGAHDGLTFNNTWFFEHARGWSGLCVEPNPTVFERLRTARRAACIACAVGSVEGVEQFTAISGYGEMLSGLHGKQGKSQQARIERDLAAHGGNRETYPVKVRRLDSLLVQHGIAHVDLVSIDVEGAELDVLGSVSMRDLGVRAVILENNFSSAALPREMHRQGFQLLARIGWDECYVPRPFRLAPVASPAVVQG